MGNQFSDAVYSSKARLLSVDVRGGAGRTVRCLVVLPQGTRKYVVGRGATLDDAWEDATVRLNEEVKKETELPF